jgi:hypothetical protein
MGKKDKKQKKVNAKKEKYKKFHKEKSGTLDISMPDLDDEIRKRAKVDQEKIDKFLRYTKNPPTKQVLERKMKSKR